MWRRHVSAESSDADLDESGRHLGKVVDADGGQGAVTGEGLCGGGGRRDGVGDGVQAVTSQHLVLQTLVLLLLLTWESGP